MMRITNLITTAALSIGFWSVLAITLAPFGRAEAQGEVPSRLSDAVNNLKDADERSDVAERLKQGVDDPDSAKNRYRGGVDSFDEVKTNMKQLLKPILSSSGGGVDKWYSPHLRDIRTTPPDRRRQARMRAEARAIVLTCPFFGGPWCVNGLGNSRTACAECSPETCPLNIKWYDDDLEPECCLGPRFSDIYLHLTTDSNFKTCCVRDLEVPFTEEKIACLHPDGSGWAGLFEYYYPTTALGWENDRTTTMIATKSEVSKCVDKTDKMMENSDAVDWVTQAIERNVKWAERSSGNGSGGISGGALDTRPDRSSGGGAAGGESVKTNVSDVIKDVRPKDKKLRFADSMQGEGLTMQPNFVSMDRAEMLRLAERFCMRPKQFFKLMDPAHDKLQKGGGSSPEILDRTIEPWTNYCPEGVELMTKTANSTIRNIDRTDTDFEKGMKAWEEDPMYCQRMNLENPSMNETKIGEAIQKSGDNRYNESSIGYTCRSGGKLNGGMVPLSLYRHAAVERRTAIGDHALSFLIAGGLFAPKMLDPGSRRSFYKRFEPRPYTLTGDFKYKLFNGYQFKGSGINELGQRCPSLTGRDYFQKNNSDQLFISDFTNRSFTQEPVINVGTDTQAFNRYVQKWAKSAGESQKEIPRRDLDKDSQNYAAAFRGFATCPLGYKRWRPPRDAYNEPLYQRLERFCGEENFGSPRAH